MSDLDDLEKFCEQVSYKVNAWSKKRPSSSDGAKEFLSRGRKSIEEVGGLRLSTKEPSRPKLKFLEGKDYG